MAQKRRARLEDRRALVTGLVRRILVRVVNGDLEVHEGVSQVRTIYLDESALLGDLQQVAEITSERSPEAVKTAAREWLERHPLTR